MSDANEVKINGVGENGHIPTYDPDDPESQKQMWRPADINQDMKEMERRKKVDMIMNSQVFREELERIIESQIQEGYFPSNLSALQQATELLLPTRNYPGMRSGQCVIPINDIKGVDSCRYTNTEKLLRCKLAAVYRLIDLQNLSQSIYNHVTVRVSQDLEHFLLNPFGLQYSEVTASSLIKVDMQGNVIDPGSTSFTFNRAGYVLHSAVHAARPDVRAVIHIHHPPCVAVSAMKCGLLAIGQEAAIIGDVSYHDYQGIAVDTEEREIVARDLGPVNKVLILRNHGVIVMGGSLEEALFYLNNVVLACEAQVRLMSVGLENIQIMSDEARLKVRSIITDNQSGVTGKPDSVSDDDKDSRVKKFKVWNLEFESQMRILDNAGFRTGYSYRYPSIVRNDIPRQKNDVEVPPAATSFIQYLEEDKWLSPLKKLMDGKKTQEKLKWVNSPNVHQKVEVVETGTSDPRKITKNAQMYSKADQVAFTKSSIAKKLFDTVSDQDLEEYKNIVEKKQRRESGDNDIPERMKPLLLETILATEKLSVNSPVNDLNTLPQSSTSPYSDDEVADVSVNGGKLRSTGSEVSAASRSSKESSPVKEIDDDSAKKDKKKKKGLRTPSFLKKKKHKNEKEDKEKVAS